MSEYIVFVPVIVILGGAVVVACLIWNLKKSANVAREDMRSIKARQEALLAQTNGRPLSDEAREACQAIRTEFTRAKMRVTRLSNTMLYVWVVYLVLVAISVVFLQLNS